jgi:hypothetical protein
MMEGAQFTVDSYVLVISGKYARLHGVVKKCTPKMVVLRLAGRKDDVRVWQSSVLVDVPQTPKKTNDCWMKLELDRDEKEDVNAQSIKIETILEQLDELRERAEELTNLVDSLQLGK